MAQILPLSLIKPLSLNCIIRPGTHDSLGGEKKGCQTSVSPNLKTVLEYSHCLFLRGKEHFTGMRKDANSIFPSNHSHTSLMSLTVAGTISVCNITPQQIKGV